MCLKNVCVMTNGLSPPNYEKTKKEKFKKKIRDDKKERK